MTNVAFIRAEARRLWDSGQVLRAMLGVEDLFPIRIVLTAPSAARPAELHAWQKETEAHCACRAGEGYRIEYAESAVEGSDPRRLPVAAVFDAPTDLVGFLGLGSELARFARLQREIRSRHPELADRIKARPMEILAMPGEDPSDSTPDMVSIPGRGGHNIQLNSDH